MMLGLNVMHVKSMHAMCVAWVSTDDAAELSAKTLVWLLLLSPAHTDSDVKITNLHHSPNGSSKNFCSRTIRNFRLATALNTANWLLLCT